ncbi:MAG: low molecular weight protein-tyrosine-phosphatase [Pseudomonadota bacterium]|nr:low molecular weight protein-tyrosine-phosphatase [Pseudomonadota bacterium]
MYSKNKVSVLFICMGNICRSPTAEGVFRDKIKKTGLGADIQIDSAGTHDYHIGKPPDRRAQEAARGRGYDLSDLRGRQVSEQDFETFDYVLAMDTDNLALLLERCPAHLQHKVRRLLSFSRRYPNLDVPDPYYGGQAGFDRVLDMVEDAAAGLIEEINRNAK